LIFLTLGTVFLVLLAVWIRSVFVAVGSALVLSYLLKPVVRFMMRFGLRQRTILLVILIGVICMVSLILVFGVPLIYRQATSIVALIPATMTTVVQRWLPYLEDYLASYGFMTAEEIHRQIASIDFMGRMESYFQTGMSGLWRTSSSLLGWVINLVFIPVLTIFLMKDDESIKLMIRRMVPLDLRGYLEHGARRIDRALRTAIKGQMIVAATLAVLYAVGFTAVGLNLGAVIGLIAGICRFVPYLDVIVGVLLSSIVLISDFSGGWSQLVMVGVVILVVQGLDGALITPSVVGDRIGLHPLVVIMSVIAFGDWFGFIGIILAVPTAAVLKVVVEIAVDLYHKSRFFLGAR
jgi:predicted PurR-regulated permease PerM